MKDNDILYELYVDTYSDA